HHRHRNAAHAAGLPIRRLHAFADTLPLTAAVRIDATLLGHDQLGSVGLVINHAGLRLGYATDLGRVPPSLLAHFRGLHGLAIESNYDRQMQDASDRPALLKRRIMGGLGHLSNEQALAAVLGVADQADLRHVVLLHLSRQCNDPRLVRRLYARQAPHLLGRLTISHQFHPTPLLHLGRPARGERVGGVGAVGRQLDFLEALPGA
ncbi:MAG: MBL fold metallo-hydrolase, partial [Planctomycetota bacterium]